jgi:PAS domain S-box-containing protein
MLLRDTPIRRKLMTVILLTCVAVLSLTCAGFITYEILAIRTTMAQGLITRAEILAANSSAALAFDTPADATDVLGALSTDPRMVSACIYDHEGNIFASYPPSAKIESFPATPATFRHRFESEYLVAFVPVTHRGRRLGTVYLKSDLSALSERYQAFAVLTSVIFLGSVLVAYLISKIVQKQISSPILILAQTAKAFSEKNDFSVRAPEFGRNEFGVLTDAFNQMLTQIQDQHHALTESEARVRAILNSALSAVIVIDAAGRVIGWNPRAETMFGWQRDEVMNRELSEIIIPTRYRDAHRAGLGRFLATGEGPAMNRLIELGALRRDGSEFPVELSISPIKSGNTVTFCGFVTDITERKRMEEVRNRMAAIVQSSDDAIISKTLDGIITSWNRGAEKIFGYAESEAIGRPITMLCPPGKNAEEPNILAKLKRGESVDHFETVRVRKDGKRVEVSVKISPLRDADGKIIGGSKIARDITEAKGAARRETAFARLGQSMGAVTSAGDAARIIAGVADELFGWDACSLDAYDEQKGLVYPIINIDTINGRRVDVPAAYDEQPPSTIARRVLEKGGQLILREGPVTFSFDAVPFGNTDRPSASLVYAPIRRGEKIIGLLSIQSYTANAYGEQTLKTLQTLADQCGGALERVRAEETVRQLNQELEQRVHDRTAQLEAVNKELEAFSYSVSHDLRAPLRHIDGFAELLRQQSASELGATGQRYLKTISDASKRMGALIDDLLVFSRMGRAELRRKKFSTDELVAEVIGEMAEDLSGRVIKWDIGRLPDVNADRSMLKQVWVNLISNAVKYSRQRDEAQIEIKGESNGSGDLEFSVRDNGAGFDMAYAEKLFGVFQRLHQAEEFEGTGIGLANVRRIILRHGGRTWAEGKVNAGATFYFTLPDI